MIEGIFDDRVFVVSLVFNVVIAAFVVFLGDQLGVGAQLSTGVVVVLGIRIFSNAAAIRRHLLGALRAAMSYHPDNVETAARRGGGWQGVGRASAGSVPGPRRRPARSCWASRSSPRRRQTSEAGLSHAAARPSWSGCSTT